MAARASTAPAPRARALAGWARLPVSIRRTAVLAVLVAAWQAPFTFDHPNKFLYASPWQTAKAFGNGWIHGSLADPTWTTLRLLFEGIGIGIGVAAAFTLFATVSTVGEDVLTLLTAILNPLPGIAILPLAMLWFGLGPTAVLFVIANATVWPMALAVTTGFKTANPTILAVGRNIGLSRLRIVTDVLAPAALPHTITGIKTAWAFGWRTVIAAELFAGVMGAHGGLGYYLNNAKLYLVMPQEYAGLVTIAVLGVLFESLFGVLQRRTVVRWGMQTS